MEFKELKVEIELLEDLLGTVPKNREVFSSYLETKKPVEEKEIEAENVEDLEEKSWTGFMSDDDGLFIYNYMVKGFLKNASVSLKNQTKVKQGKSKVNAAVKILPRKIYFGKQKADGILERPLRAQTAQGPRVCLARSDIIKAGSRIKFTIQYLKGTDISEKLIKELLKYGEWQGLGQWRNSEYGTFKVLSCK